MPWFLEDLYQARMLGPLAITAYPVRHIKRAIAQAGVVFSRTIGQDGYIQDDHLQKVERLPDADRRADKTLLEAFLTTKQLQTLAR